MGKSIDPRKTMPAKPRRHRCAFCGELKDTGPKRANPFVEEIYGRIEKHYICDHDYRELCDDI